MHSTRAAAQILFVYMLFFSFSLLLLSVDNFRLIQSLIIVAPVERTSNTHTRYKSKLAREFSVR